MAKIILDVQLNSTNATKQIASLTQSIQKAVTAVNKAQTGENSFAGNKALQSVQKLQSQYAHLLQSTQGLEKYYSKGIFKGHIAEIQKALAAVQSYNRGTATTVQYTEEEQAAIQQLQEKFVALKADIDATAASNKNLHGSLTEIVGGFLKFQLAAMVVMKPLQLLRDAYSSLNETLQKTEDAVIALQRVVGSQANANDLYDLAQSYGQTFENVQEIALNFARTGMSWNETLSATKAALLALNVAELDATQASDGLIAVMQQFGYEASDLEGLIDKLNITADNAAVTTEKLLEALQRTGSSAVNANLSLEETVSIITALSEATGRSGSNLGTAVNSLIQFSTKASSLETFAKLGGDVAKTVEDYQKGAATVLDIWTELSKVIQDKNSSSESILGGLFGDDDWRTLNEELQETLGENFATVTEIYGTASTFRKNYFIALLNNMDEVQSAMDTMQNSAGYSAKENEQYLNTYTAKVNALQAQWQALANDEQGWLKFKKGLVDTGSAILTVIEWTGGLRTTTIALGSAILVTFGPKAISAVKSFGLSLAGAFGTAQAAAGWIGLLATGISVLVGVIQKSVSEAESYRKQVVENYIASDEQNKQLDELYEKYKKLTPETAEFYELEKEITKLLSYDKRRALQNIIEDTKEYTAELEKQYKIQKAQNDIEKQNAIKSAKSNIANTWIGGGLDQTNVLSQTEKDVYDKLGAEYYERYDSYGPFWNPTKLFVSRYLKNLDSQKDFETQLANYETLESWKNTLLGWYEVETDADRKKALESVYDVIQQELNAAKEIVEQYRLLIGYTNEVVEETGKVEETTSKWHNSLTEVTGKYADILSAIKEIREEEETRLNLEEKRQALLDAQNERNVKVFNAATNQWEWQANEKDIADAKKEFEKAGYETIISMLEKGIPITNYEMEKALASIDELIPGFRDTVVSTINEQSSVDLDKYRESDAFWSDFRQDLIAQISESGTKTVSGIHEIVNSLKEDLAIDELPEKTSDFIDKIIENRIQSISTQISSSLSGKVQDFSVAVVSPEFYNPIKTELKEQLLNGLEESSSTLENSVDDKNFIATAINALNDFFGELFSGFLSLAEMSDDTNDSQVEIEQEEDVGGGSTGDTISLATRTKGLTSKIYDSGGLLQGMGGIKATSEDEFVLPPDITKALLTPTSTQRSQEILDGMRLLFGATDTSPVIGSRDIIRNNATTNNTTNSNNVYNVNGVPVSREMAETHTLVEICEAMKLVN